MTFTSDERREVAWRLRTEVSEGECIDYAVCRIINDVLGVNGAWGAKAARILADPFDGVGTWHEVLLAVRKQGGGRWRLTCCCGW